MSGQNKRINNQIEKIYKTIDENELELIEPICFLDNEGNRMDDGKSETYDGVINNISETIGELRGLTMPTSARTPQKKDEYKEKIKELEGLKDSLKEKRKISEL